jgi:hypothetical protein
MVRVAVPPLTLLFASFTQPASSATKSLGWTVLSS